MSKKSKRDEYFWLRAMEQQVRSGALSAATHIFDEHKADLPYEAVLLRAKVYLKAGEAAEARALLRSHPAPARDTDLQIRHALLTATAHAVAGRFDVSDEEFQRAESLLKNASDPSLSAELPFRKAARYAAEGDLKRARYLLPAAKAFKSDEAAANAAFVEGYILAREGRYVEQSSVYRRLLERLDSDGGENEEARIYATWNLAILARETPIQDALPLVQRHIEKRDWPIDCVRQRFEALKAIGWCHALRGDYFNAFRSLKQALVETEKDRQESGDARRCVAHLDRAYLARCNEEYIFERQELEEAEILASRITWSAVVGEERVALLLLAELFAPIDSGKATYYIGKYDALPPLSNRWQHFSGDERVEHLANYSRAMVDIASGHKRSATKLLRSAYSYYERIQYSWRAGRCALRLFELTKEDEWHSRAREMLRNYSGSWLARDLVVKINEDVQLPPMQQKVFECICQGLSNAQIASEMERSEFTVRNHVKEIFKRFGVRSRSALIAEAMRRNLI